MLRGLLRDLLRDLLRYGSGMVGLGEDWRLNGESLSLFNDGIGRCLVRIDWSV